MAEPKAARPVSGAGVRSLSPVDSSKAADFAEIFGGLEASCSIPFLELPVGFEDPDDDRGGERRFVEDYEEIFGGFGGSNLGISCGEMNRPDDLNGRVPKEIGLGFQEVESSKLSPQQPDGEFVTCLGKDQILLDLVPLKDRLKQLSMSNRKSGWKSIEETTSGATGFSCGSNACSSQNSGRNSTSEMDANDLNTHGDSNLTIEGWKQEKTSTPVFEGVKNSVNMNDLEQLSTSVPTSEDDYMNLKSCRHSSSCRSTSSGGISCPEVAYVSVSDISLQTQPLLVSPPSRPPLEVASRHSHYKIKTLANMKDDVGEGGSFLQTNKSQKYWKAFSKGDALQSSLSNSSSCFYDEEVDAGSAAAAAAADAAMKEAMEQARVRLKIAKMSMDRKRDNFKGHKDLVKLDSLNCMDEEAKAVKASSEDITQIITMGKEDEEIKGFIPQDRQKHMRAAKIASNYEEKESQAAGEEHAIQGKKAKSSQSKLEEKSGEGKIESQSCELTNNDNKVEMVDQVSEQENVEKEMKAKEDKDGQDNEGAKIPTELKKTRKLWAVCEPHQVKNKLKLNADIVASREEEIREIITAIREVHLQDKNLNMLERAHDSNLEDETEGKAEEAPIYHLGVEYVKQTDIQVAPIYINNEKNLENFDHDCRYETLSKSEAKNKNSKTFKKVDQCKESETKSYVTCDPQESERVKKLTNKTSVNPRRNLKSRTDHASPRPWRN